MLHSVADKEHYLGEGPLSIQLQQKTPMIPVKRREAITWCYHESTPRTVTKRNGTQRRTHVSMHCMYCSMPKGTCQAEVTSNSENLCLSEGIS